jgi:glutathione S-transferase
MKLYYAPGACSLSPHIVAREAGIPIELEKVDLGAKKTASGEDYKKINPKGYVPALKLNDGSVLTEGPAIVQYLADQKPESNLAPKATTQERYRLQEWLGFINSEIHKGWSPLWNAKATPEMRQAALDKLSLRLDWLGSELNGKQHVMGDRFSVADAYLFTVLNWAQPTKVDLSKWPALQQFVTRTAARPKVQEAMKAEGILQ